MRQIVGHRFGCINPIRNEKILKIQKKGHVLLKSPRVKLDNN